MTNLDELRQEILKQSYVDTTVIRWSKLPDEPIEQKAQAIVEIPIDDLMDIIELFIANQVREAYRKGYNDNARDCYCDSAKVIESLIPHKHLMDDGKSHDIRPDLPKGDDK